MKIALLSREYPPDTAWGGIATVFHSLACALVREGHEVHVVCQAVGKPQDLLQEGVQVHRVGTRPARYSPLARINYSLHAWRKLRDLVRRQGIEIVQASIWGAEAFLCSLKKPVPLVVMMDISASNILGTKSYSSLKEAFSLRVLAFLEAFSAKRSDRLIAISNELHDKAVQKLHIPAGKIDTVYHAVDTGKFRFIPSDVREKLKIPGDAPLVLLVGRLEMRKGVLILAQSINGILHSRPSTRFLLVGRDTNSAAGGVSVRSFILQQARQAGFEDRILFIDYLMQDELVLYYSACDVLVSPSLLEGNSMVIIEAMACGKPVVATPTGIIPELELEGFSGMVVPFNDVEKLTVGIVKMISLNEVDKQAVALNNRTIINRYYSIKSYAIKIIEVYQKALRK
jgi:glycosyltransferase involved in cell wall biosynthesis